MKKKWLEPWVMEAGIGSIDHTVGKSQLFYDASIKIIHKKKALQLLFFTKKEGGIYRQFIWDDGFIGQWLQTWLMGYNQNILYIKGRWSTAMLTNQYSTNLDNAIPVRKKAEAIIESFVRDKHILPDGNNALIKIIHLQEKIRYKQLMEQHQKEKKAINDNFIGIKPLPKSIESWIENDLLYKEQFIFYKKTKGQTDGYATCCQKEVSIEQGRHNKTGICPLCNREITYKAKGYSKNIKDYFIFNHIQKLPSHKLLLRGYELTRQITEVDNAFIPAYSYYEYKRKVENAAGTFETFHWGNYKQTNNNCWCAGHPSPFYSPRNFWMNGMTYKNNLAYVFKNHPLEHAHIIEFAKSNDFCNVFEYIEMVSENKTAGLFMKHKLEYLATAMIDSYGNEVSKLLDILSRHRSYLPLFRDIKITKDELMLLHYMPTRKYISKELILKIRRLHAVNAIIPSLAYSSPIRLLNYLEKKAPITNYSGEKTVDISLWLDYISFAKELGYDISSDFIKYPRHLHSIHDDMTEKLAGNANKENDAKIIKQYEQLNDRFYFERNHLIIRPPVTGKEVRLEGSHLKHCVGRYVDRIATEKTTILFIRQKEAVETPFFTVEYQKGKIIQCRGACNTKTTEEINEFLYHWEKFLKRKEANKHALAM